MGHEVAAGGTGHGKAGTSREGAGLHGRRGRQGRDGAGTR